jgi:BirA family transcriptional regulator, biotin operon repressor / biotin---[acetyl-CoA-carboxylase] ligase
VKRNARDNLLNNYHLLSYDVLDSTNEEAKRLAAGGASHGAVIWARRQTAGRGRLQRQWVSEEGNLFVSLLLEPQVEFETASQLSFVAAVAAIEALKPIVPHEKLGCKWPNDILLNGKKLGGILLESFATPNEQKKNKERRWVIVGVGINVDSAPEGLDFPASSLKEAGVEIISAKIVLARFVHHFIETYDLWQAKGFAPIRKAWLEHAWGIGKKLEVRLPDEKFNGVMKGIDRSGMLQVTLPGGRNRNVSAGDVFFG